MSKNLLGKVKKKEGEILTPANIKKVIGLLEASPAITKKEACEILNISYNTTRLSKIIDEFKEEEAETLRRRRANIGKSITNFEVQVVIEGYLRGDSIKEISDRIYRSSDTVKKIVLAVGIPDTSSEYNYSNVGLVPEQCMSDIFRPGQIVWSMKHNSVAMIVSELHNQSSVSGDRYYRIYVIEPYEHQTKWFKERNHGGRYSGSFAYDLASLDHLANYGIDIYSPYKNIPGVAVSPTLGKDTVHISNILVSEKKKTRVRPTLLRGSNIITVIPDKGTKRLSSIMKTNIRETELCI